MINNIAPMPAPLLSIMVVTYNHGLYVAQALDGILMQQVNFSYEIIIGDDASEDDTLVVCKQYQLKHPDIITIIANESNKGLLNNYFDTLLSCQGAYIADCSGDDYWIDPLKLQKQVDILSTHSEVTMVHTNWKLYYQEAQKMVDDAKTTWGGGKETTLQYDENGWRATLGFSFCPAVFTSCCCFRKEAFLLFYNKHQELFRDRQYPCEDLQLTFAMLYQGTLWYIDEDSSVYRLLNNSTLHSKDLRKHFDFELGVTRLRLTISSKFGLPSSILEAYVQSNLQRLYRISIRLLSPTMIQQVELLRSEFGLTLKGRTQLLSYICHCPILFQITHYIIGAIRLFKHN